MKRIRFIAIFLCVSMVVLVFVGCAKPITAMEYEGESVSVNMYSYWMSQIKSNYVSAQNNTDEYWNTKYSNGQTYEEKMREIVDFNVKINLVCQKLFRDMGLKISQTDMNEIETALSDLLNSYGSKSELNSVLAVYNINYNMLKEIYEIELRTNLVYEALYSEDGLRRIDDKALDKYYKNNYNRMDMILVYDTFEYKMDEDGNVVFDETTNSYVKETLTEEESKAKNDLADSIMKRLEAGEDFDALKAEFNEDPQGDVFKDGYYISSNDISTYGTDIVVASESMEIGEIKKVDDGNIIYIMKRKELMEKPYTDEAYADQFENLVDYCEQADFNKYMESLIDNVTVYTDETEKVSVRKSALMSH